MDWQHDEGSAARTSWSAGSRAPRSRLCIPSNSACDDEIDSGSEEDRINVTPAARGEAQKTQRESTLMRVEPAAYSRPVSDCVSGHDNAPRRANTGLSLASRKSGNLVAGLSLTPDQLGVALPAGSSRGGNGRRSHGAFGLQAQRALLAVEADRSMLHARYGIGLATPLNIERLRRILCPNGVASRLLRVAAVSDTSQPLILVSCRQIHPVISGSGVDVLLHRQTFENVSVVCGGSPASILIFAPWLEYSGMLMAYHCQAVIEGAVDEISRCVD
eukprot:scaffold303202_cov32-Tisochrysis_lutea.AAC.1